MAYSSPLFPKPQRARPAIRELPKAQADEVKFAFELLDQDNDGDIGVKQVKVALRALGFAVKKADVVSMLKNIGHESRAVNFECFKELVTDKLLERSRQEELDRAFRLFDLDNKGKIDLSNLRKVARQLQVSVEDGELLDMITEFDGDGDEAINLQEFATMLAGGEDF